MVFSMLCPCASVFVSVFYPFTVMNSVLVSICGGLMSPWVIKPGVVVRMHNVSNSVFSSLYLQAFNSSLLKLRHSVANYKTWAQELCNNFLIIHTAHNVLIKLMTFVLDSVHSYHWPRGPETTSWTCCRFRTDAGANENPICTGRKNSANNTGRLSKKK